MLERIINRIIDVLGLVCVVLMVLLLLNVFYDVVMRYVFNDSSIGMQELEWHLFALVFLLGVAYTLKEDSHVRVDILYEKFSPKKKAILNIVGIIIFIIPFSIVVLIGSWTYTIDAFTIGEGSPDPGGLPYRFIIKGSIVLSFAFLILSSMGFILRSIKVFLTDKA
jgi:TRAP-type mannitol/chloroaromatic compound transport system permease small subunit